MIIKPRKRFLITPDGRPVGKPDFESSTSLGKARHCLRTYWEYYERQFRPYSSTALVFGLAWHGTVEDAMVEKYHTGYLLSEARLKEIFSWRWNFEYKLARDDGLIWGGRFSPEQLQQKGFALLNVWRDEFADVLTPADIPEPPFWIPLTGCKRALSGRLDLVVKEQGGGLIDYKTSSSAWDDQDPEWHKGVEFQIALYHLGFYHIYKTWPAWVHLHRPILTGKPRIEVVPMLMDDEHVQGVIDNDVKPLMHKIEEAWEASERDKNYEWPCTCSRKDHVRPADTKVAEATSGDAGSPAA